MVKVELIFDSIEEAVRTLTGIRPGTVAVFDTAPAQAEAPLEEEKPKRTRKAKAKAEEATPEPVTEAEPAAEADDDAAIDYASTSALVIEYGKRTSPGAALELMKQATNGKLQKLSQADEGMLRVVYGAFEAALAKLGAEAA